MKRLEQLQIIDEQEYEAERLTNHQSMKKFTNQDLQTNLLKGINTLHNALIYVRTNKVPLRKNKQLLQVTCPLCQQGMLFVERVSDAVIINCESCDEYEYEV